VADAWGAHARAHYPDTFSLAAMLVVPGDATDTALVRRGWLTGLAAPVTALAPSACLNIVAAGALDGRVALFSLDNGRRLRLFTPAGCGVPAALGDPVCAALPVKHLVALQPGYIAAHWYGSRMDGSHASAVGVLHLNGPATALVTPDTVVTALASSADGTAVLVGCADGIVQVRHGLTLELGGRLRMHEQLWAGQDSAADDAEPGRAASIQAMYQPSTAPAELLPLPLPSASPSPRVPPVAAPPPLPPNAAAPAVASAVASAATPASAADGAPIPAAASAGAGPSGGSLRDAAKSTLGTAWARLSRGSAAIASAAAAAQAKVQGVISAVNEAAAAAAEGSGSGGGGGAPGAGDRDRAASGGAAGGAGGVAWGSSEQPPSSTKSPVTQPATAVTALALTDDDRVLLVGCADGRLCVVADPAQAQRTLANSLQQGLFGLVGEGGRLL
jgi:hypothetical protein